jgi:hypothetical protein
VKKTDLEKAKGKQIANEMRRTATPGRYAQQATQAVSRKEQRKRDQALGLVPFAVKLPSGLVDRLRTLADERRTELGELTAELLQSALSK